MDKKQIRITSSSGKLVYEGPEQRTVNYPTSGPALPFGLRVAEIIQIGILLSSLIIFVAKTDERINSLEKRTQYLSDFAQNSDVWNSTVVGVQFRGGKPIDGEWLLKRQRTIGKEINEQRSNI